MSAVDAHPEGADGSDIRIKYLIPFPFDSAGVAARSAGIPRHALAPTTKVDCAVVRDSFDTGHPKSGLSLYEVLLLEMFVVEAGLDAERELYDAVVIDTMSDSGLDALRSRLTIPVLGQGTASVCTAMALGKRLAFLVYLPEHRFIIEKVIAAHGIGHRCASIRSLDLTPDYEHLLSEDLEAHVARMAEVGATAISEDRAEVIVLGSGTMYQAAGPLQAALGIPVVDPAAVTLRMAEGLVRLGLSHSKLGYPSPAKVQDEKFRGMGRA